MKKYYVIKYDKGLGWHMTHPNGMDLASAKIFAITVPNSNVIHEMWLDCLLEWPTPDCYTL